MFNDVVAPGSNQGRVSHEYVQTLFGFVHSIGGMPVTHAPTPMQIHKLWSDLANYRPGVEFEFANFLQTRPPFLLSGRLITHSRNVREGLARATRSPFAVGCELHLRLPQLGQLSLRGFVPSGEIVESNSFGACVESAAVLIQLGRLLERCTNVAAPWTRVQLRRPRTSDSELFARHFGVPVEFSAPEDSISVAESYASLPMLNADVVLGDHLDRYACQLNEQAWRDRAQMTPMHCSAPKVEDNRLSDALRIRYRLTSAEAELGSLLLTGETVRDAARLRGTTERTARHQLHSIFRKTGTSRQVDFVRSAMSEIAQAGL